MNFNINFNITSLNQKGHFRILIITKELIIYKALNKVSFRLSYCHLMG